MTDDHYNTPEKGTEDWHAPLNENFADLGIEVATEVQTWSDLPATDKVTRSSDGQWPVYRIAEDSVYVRVTDNSKEIVGGIGSTGHPLPESHHETINTNNATIGDSTPYKYISEKHTTVTVPGDYSTIQAAINDCAKNLRHEYIIDVDSGSYDEDIVVRGVGNQGTTGPEGSTGGFGAEGEPGIIQIIGDTNSPSNVTITSAFAAGCTGTQAPTFWGVEFSGDPSPFSDEDACVEFMGCQQAVFR